MDKNKSYKLFELGSAYVINGYTRLPIIGLNTIYYKSLDGQLTPVEGSVGLAYASDEYPGYCQLYFTYRSEKYADGLFSVDFKPAYTNDGDYILIKTPIESPYLIFSSSLDTLDANTLTPIKSGYLTYKTNGWNSKY